MGLALFLLLAAGLAASSSSSATPPAAWNDGRGGIDQAGRDRNYQAIREMGRTLERAGLFGPGFGDWLAAVAFVESRGNPAAGSDAFSNAARGAFGMRPTTAWNETEGREWAPESADLAFNDGQITAGEVEALKDLPWAVALAAHNVSRLRAYADGQPYTMLAARRGWAYPRLVSDTANAERPELLTRWAQALAYLGLPPNFGDRLLEVLIPRSSFPEPAAIRAILLADRMNEAGAVRFEPDTFEGGQFTDPAGVWSWSLGRLGSGAWSWRVELWSAGRLIAFDEGITTTRDDAARAVIEATETP